MLSELGLSIRGLVEPLFLHPGVRSLRYANQLRERGLMDAGDGRRLNNRFPDANKWVVEWMGKLPAGWDDRRVIRKDLETARRLRIQLPPDLITACLSHPNRGVVVDLGETQVLDDPTYWVGLGRIINKAYKDRYSHGQERLSGVQRGC